MFDAVRITSAEVAFQKLVVKYPEASWNRAGLNTLSAEITFLPIEDDPVFYNN